MEWQTFHNVLEILLQENFQFQTDGKIRGIKLVRWEDIMIPYAYISHRLNTEKTSLHPLTMLAASPWNVSHPKVKGPDLQLNSKSACVHTQIHLHTIRPTCKISTLTLDTSILLTDLKTWSKQGCFLSSKRILFFKCYKQRIKPQFHSHCEMFEMYKNLFLLE